MTRLVITGAGVVSAIGVGKEQTLKSLLEHKSGVDLVRYLQTEHKECMVGEVKLTNREMMQMLGLSNQNEVIRTSLLGMLALREALDEAGLTEQDIRETAFINGTTVGGMDQSEQFYLDYLKDVVSGETPVEYIQTHDCGSSTDLIADYAGHFAMTTSISTACSSAANAFVLGARMIESGEFERVVVGGSECLSKFHLNGFNSLMILDQQPCRPFDATRAGLNLGEGAAFLVLETEASAVRRGASVLGVLEGFGNACDAFHQTASSADGEGAFRAMQQAIDKAGLLPSDIDYVNCHGTGTPNNDPSEIAAMRRIFGATLPSFSSTKGFTGHTTSASGSIEAVFCLLAMKHHFMPVSLNWKQPIEPDVIPVDAVQSEKNVELHHVLCNAFGFGGNDSALVFGKYETES